MTEFSIDTEEEEDLNVHDLCVQTKTTDLRMRLSPFIRSFGDTSSSMIVMVISAGRSVRVTLVPSEFGPGRLVANVSRSAAGLHHAKTKGGASTLTEYVLLHGPRI